MRQSREASQLGRDVACHRRSFKARKPSQQWSARSHRSQRAEKATHQPKRTAQPVASEIKSVQLHQLPDLGWDGACQRIFGCCQHPDGRRMVRARTT